MEKLISPETASAQPVTSLGQKKAHFISMDAFIKAPMRSFLLDIKQAKSNSEPSL